MEHRPQLPPAAEARGRGAVSNDGGRFERERREWVDDGWGTADEPAPPLRTELIRDKSRSILSTNASPDIGFNRSVNAYRGCEHGCVYCFARPSHAYLGFSPGLDFESRILIKPEAPALLRKELMRPGYRPEPIAFGANTDPYQPAERKLGISRELLKVALEFRQPVIIVTKSQLVVRDLDLLTALAEEHLVKVMVSVTSLDRKLSRRMEPRASTPEKRLATIRALSTAGVPVGALNAPIIPAINDHEIEDLVAACAQAGAESARYILLRLPLELKALWREWLERHYPDRAARVMRHIREARGGRDYDPSFGQRMVGTGPYAEMIARRHRLAVRRNGLDRTETVLDSSNFRRPPAPEAAQFDLFA